MKLELSLEQIVHGLCTDINKLEVARAKNDDPTVKKAEESLSYGLQTLAEVMKDKLPFRRECMLTAFSLTPTEKLFKEIEKLAQDSGFKKDTKNEDMEVDKFEMKEDLNHFESVCQDFLLTQYFYATQLLFHDCRVDLAHITSIIFGLNIFDE